MRGAIHHLDLTVKDPRASHGFYAAVLGYMGYREVAERLRCSEANARQRVSRGLRRVALVLQERGLQLSSEVES